MVLGTGGTIAGRAARAGDNLGYVAGQVQVGELLTDVPIPEGITWAAEQVCNIDSKDMSHAHWRALACRCQQLLDDPGVRGIVITHGTDTLEETAFFLGEVLMAHKPVVLTCAMRPASSPAPDGPQNLRDALAVAVADGARGVLAVCAGTIHRARHVRKVHTYRLDAFSSGESGPVGFVEEGRIRRVCAWPEVLAPRLSAQRLPAADLWPSVQIITSHAGADTVLVDALVQAGGVDGIVVAATGNGTVHESLQEALAKAQAAGIAVVRATRCADGAVLSSGEDRCPHAFDLSPVKARISLMLHLMDSRHRPA